jgi:hypothetical protein
MFGFSFIELLVVLFSGSPIGLPLSLPPLPPDPAMSQVAPKECLWYLSWAGCAEPDAASKNHTEQLLAEQEVRRFASELETRLRDAIKRGAPQGSQAQQAAVLADEGPNLLKLVLTRPTAIFVESAIVGPQGAIVKGGVVISAGEHADAAKKSIRRIVAAMQLPAADPAKSPDEGLKIPLPPQAPPVELRWHKNYLIVGVGEGMTDEIRKRFGGATPEWLANLRRELPVERPAVTHYLNVRTALTMAIPFAGVEGFKIVNTLGLDRLKHFASVSGLEGEGAVTRSQLAIDGPARGLLAFLDNAALKQADLALIPKDATFAVAAKLNAAAAMQRLINLIGQFDAGSQQAFNQELAALEQQLGFKLSDDVLQSLGDTWCVYNSPGEGGLLFTGLTAVVTVKDRQRILKAHDQLLAKVRAANEELERLQDEDNPRGRRLRTVEVADFKFREHTVYFLSFIGDDVAVAPAWCITDKELIVSLFPQMIKARLARGTSAGTLADLPEVVQCFQKDRQPAFISYQDTKSVLRLAYPILHFFAAMICNEIQAERVHLDMSLLPSMAAIEPHLQPGVSALYVGSQGYTWQSRQTLPGAGSAPALLLPAVFGFASFRSVRTFNAAESGPTVLDLQALSPEGAQRTVSINNLKQIGLAMHNYLAVHNHFPVSDGAGEDGKPKLSWRVHILPFLEQQTLYEQFKLDEPWDSEHNKKLIEKMPKVYAAPGSKVAGEHKTNYLVVEGKDALLPPGKEIKPADITDGFSNTAMVLEVDDKLAVVWTNPDDFEPKKDNPLDGVVGLRNGKFLLLLADGSVRTPPASIDKETVRALFTRAGGETVRLND